MKIHTKIVFFAALAGLTGCASNIVHEGKYSQDDGWRKGTVVEIAPGKTLSRPSFYDCRTTALDREGNDPYAVVALLRNGHLYTRAAKLPADAGLQVGDKVYVDIKDCEAPLPKRDL